MIDGSISPNLKPENIKKGVMIYEVLGSKEIEAKLEFAGHRQPCLVADNTRSPNGSSGGLLQINDHKSNPNKKVIRVSTNGVISGSSVPSYFDHVSYGEIDLNTGILSILGTATAQANNNGDGGINLANTESFIGEFDGQQRHAFTRGEGSPNRSFNRFYYHEQDQLVYPFRGDFVSNYNPSKIYPRLPFDDILGAELKYGDDFFRLIPEVGGESVSYITATSTLTRG